jgi:plasmid maintenance system antidote protein VapI
VKNGRLAVREFLRERNSVTAEKALRLSRLFPNTPELRLNARRAVDLRDVERRVAVTIGRIKLLSAA